MAETFSIQLKTETCDAIREAAPKYGLKAAPRSVDPIEIALTPDGMENVHLVGKVASLFKTTPLSHDEQALALIS